MRRHEPLQLPLMRIPIALWVISFAADLGSLRWGPAAVRVAFFCVAAGVALALMIAAATALDYNRIAATSPSRWLIRAHAAVLVTTLLVFALDAWIRATAFDALSAPLGAFSLTALGLLLLALADFLRRQITFDRRGTIIRLVRSDGDDAPAGTIPFRRPRSH